MGNFYFNYTLKGRTAQDAALALKGRRALVTPVKNDCVVALLEFDALIDFEFASRVSEDLKCPLLSVAIHDDDVMMYRLLVCGALRDEYDSSPDDFSGGPNSDRRGPTGGNAKLLCETFGNGNPESVETILRATDRYRFEIDRHQALVEELLLSPYAVALGYEYASQGDIPTALGLKLSDMVAID